MAKFIRCLILCLFLVVTSGNTIAFAQEKPATESAVTDAVEHTKDAAKELADEVKRETSEQVDQTRDQPSLSEDIKKAREILMGGAGDSSFLRGMIVAMLQPIFIASMFCLGLWAGQMSERLRHIWVLPVIVYVATVIGAFISVYHSEWKPQFDNQHFRFLAHLESTEVVAILIGLLVGLAVGLQWVIPSFFAMIGAVGIGLVLGFSQTDIGDHPNSLLPFWAGFGLTGLLVNIFGIGFETFFQSINLKMISRLVGIATAALSLFYGAKIL